MLGRLLKKMGNSAGILEPRGTHDLRRGAARDIAHLPIDKLAIYRGKVTASVLGKSSQATDVRVTEHYVGGIQEDFWTLRAMNKPVRDIRVQVD